MTSADTTTRIVLIDLSGEAKVRYLPLGALYLKAAVAADRQLATTTEVTIQPFLAGTGVATMTAAIVADEPAIVGFSCQGWNIAVYEQLIPTLRQLLPDALFVLGGNHVTDQGERWLRRLPQVDLVVNGEGESTFRELVGMYVGGGRQWAAIGGLTYREGATIATTAPRSRVTALEEVVSPFLAGLLDEGAIDIALWETNRGCPYHCAFCHWGGAVGQKVTRALPDRLREELEMMGRAGVPAIFICDANFGILPQDVDIARMVVEVHSRYGALHTLHVNWAKNHAERVSEILDILGHGGVRTNVFLALQTLDPVALQLAGRDQRGRAAMRDLAARILRRGGDVGAELIFGLPGETLAQFRSAYDDLYVQFPSLLLHPLWILPNTTYHQERERYGLITIRPDPLVDYEGVLSHLSLSIDDNRAGLRLLLADDILVGSGYARTTLRALARWGHISPSALLDRFADFVDRSAGSLSAQLASLFRIIGEEVYFHRHLRGAVRRAIYTDRGAAQDLLDGFVAGLCLNPEVSAACREFVRYDCALLPRADLPDLDGQVEKELDFAFDAPAADRALLHEATPIPAFAPVMVRISHRAGFARHLDDAIDLSATWRGRVIAVEPAAAHVT